MFSSAAGVTIAYHELDTFAFPNEGNLKVHWNRLLLFNDGFESADMSRWSANLSVDGWGAPPVQPPAASFDWRARRRKSTHSACQEAPSRTMIAAGSRTSSAQGSGPPTAGCGAMA